MSKNLLIICAISGGLGYIGLLAYGDFRRLRSFVLKFGALFAPALGTLIRFFVFEVIPFQVRRPSGARRMYGQTDGGAWIVMRLVRAIALSQYHIYNRCAVS